MVSNRALRVTVGRKPVKFRRCERLNPNPQVAKIMARKSGVPKSKKTAAKKTRPPLDDMQREMRKARDHRARGSNQPEKTKCWLFWGPMDVLEVTNTL